MIRYAIASAVVVLHLGSAASAQTANSSPTAPSPGGAGAPSSSTTGPSGGAAKAGASSQPAGETVLEKQERIRQDKVTTICKGC